MVLRKTEYIDVRSTQRSPKQSISINDSNQPITIFIGFVPNQAALRGLMTKISDLNLKISLAKLVIYPEIGEKPNENNDQIFCRYFS